MAGWPWAGFRQIKGMRDEDASWIAAARGNGYPDVESLWRRAGVHPDALERLAEADGFASLASPAVMRSGRPRR